MILKPRISGDVKYKRRWEIFGAILGILLGYPIFLIISLIPDYSTDLIFNALTFFFPDLLAGINPLLGTLPYILQGILASINDVSASNPYYPITFIFISFVEFPCCIGWIVPGILVAYYRNTQYYNIEIKNNGWKVFWHGTIFIQLLAIIFIGGLTLFFGLQFIPGISANDALLAYFGGGIIALALFLLSPFFWLGLFFAGLGGYIGTVLAMRKVSPAEIVVEEVEPEAVFEEKLMIKKGFKDLQESEEVVWPEEAKTKEELKVKDQDIKAVNVDRLKEKIRATAQEGGTEDFIECSGCGKKLPKGAKFCNNCGNKIGGK